MAVGTGAAILGAAALGALGSKSGPKSSTVTQDTSPWGPIQPYLLDIAQKGQSLYNRGSISPFTQQAESLTAQRALDPNSLVARSQGILGDTISGRYLTPDSNPYFKSYIDEALGQARSAFAGQYGGVAGSNLNNSGYQEALSKNLGQIATNAYSNLYNQERQNQLNATQVAPTLDYANLIPLAQVGAVQDARPFNDLYRYQQAITPALGFNSGSTTTPLYSNPISGALGGAFGIAGLNRLTGGSLFGSGGTRSITGDPVQDAALAAYGI